MSTATRLALSAALAAGLAACANTAMVHDTDVGGYMASMLNSAAGQGAMKTEIIGNPFDGPKEDQERAVTGGLARSRFGPGLTFATSVSPDNRAPYRVALVFNPRWTTRSETSATPPVRRRSRLATGSGSWPPSARRTGPRPTPQGRSPAPQGRPTRASVR